jgi:thioredoxin-like negative regulator of GroEL
MLLISALLFVIVMTVFWPSISNGFINYDEELYITLNHHVQGGLNWEGVKWAFFKPEAWLGYYQPLTLLSHMADCQLFGLKSGGHHLTSMLLHAVNTVLVFLLLRTMTGAIWRSALVAALFGLHPLQVEAVAWAAERKGVLSACFGLLALIFYARYVQTTKSRKQKAGTGGRFQSSVLSPLSSGHYWLSLLFLALGLMSKPMLVTWPFVMLLLDYWPLQRLSHLGPLRSVASRHASLLWEKIPFFGLTAATNIVAVVMQKQAGALEANTGLTLGAKSGNALVSYCRYLGKMFWPTDLAIFYPHPGHWPMATVLTAGAVVLSISILVFVMRRRSPFLLVGWLWFVGTLVPVIGLIQVGMQSMADRYTYIPNLGLLLLLVWGASEPWQRCHWPAHVLTLLLVALLGVSAFLTRRQIAYWQNGLTIFGHALEVTTHNEVAYTHLGDYLLKHGEPKQAMAMFRESIRIDPRVEQPQAVLGYLLFVDGQREAAIHQLEQAVTILPDSAAIRSNLGLCYKEQGRYPEAVVQLQEAIRLKPEFPEAQVGLASIWLKQGSRDQAILLLKQALQSRPGLPVAGRMLRQATADAPH